MNTWSHYLVNAALNRPIRKTQAGRIKRKLPNIRSRAFLLGGILPDVPLILMGFVMFVADLLVGNYTLADIMAGPGGNGEGPPAAFQQSYIGTLFDDWFFNNPIVLALHNLFGSPLLLLAYIAAGFWLWRNGRQWGGTLFWLAIGCMLHTLADIPLHHDDGPLLLFPLNWDIRFESPFSYWDSDHGAAAWSTFEVGLDIVLFVWLLGGWLWRKVKGIPPIKLLPE